MAKKKIGIIDADLLDHGTRHPNLALMKISQYYQDKGYTVELITKKIEPDSLFSPEREYKEIFVSKVFSFSKTPFDSLIEEGVITPKNNKFKNYNLGGTGFFGIEAQALPKEIENHMPDYHLYDEWVKSEIESGKKPVHYMDYTDFSIGFMTRGCFRKCEFCVNKKYDHVFRNTPIDNFYNKDLPYIYLWDDNILAFNSLESNGKPGWLNVLDELDSTGKPFQFRQGVDLRLMTDEKAKRLNNAHWFGDFIFAFDHVEDKELITEKLELWKRYSSQICKLYVLCAFDSQDEVDIKNTFERIKILMEHGSLPYIMRYEKYKGSKYEGMYVQLARWCNQPSFFKKKSFRQYCVANQEYAKGGMSGIPCSAYKAMIDFEKEHPDIAKEYFDLRYDQLNMYKKQYGYGRKYANKTSCNECKKNLIPWKEFLKNSDKWSEIILLYMNKEIDFTCCDYQVSVCKKVSDYIVLFLQCLKKETVKSILNILEKSFYPSSKTINKYEFIYYRDSLDIITKLFKFFPDQQYVFELDDFCNKFSDFLKSKNIVLNKSKLISVLKLATEIDILLFRNSGKMKRIELSKLGVALKKYSIKYQLDIIKKLSLRNNCIRSFIANSDSLFDIMTFSKHQLEDFQDLINVVLE